MEFKKEEVLNNLAVVCRSYSGTLDHHEYLQKSLHWLKSKLDQLEELQKPKEVKEEKKEVDVKS